MDLNALRSTLAIAEHGGIAGASRATRIPRSTLSRHLAELEQALGTRLVERTSRRFRLTAEGAALVALADEPMRGLADVAERIRPGDKPLTGRLRISVPILFGHTLLGRVAIAFAHAHPDVFLDVVVGDRPVDLLGEGFDAAVRVNPAPHSTLTGRLLARNHLILVATPELAGRLGYEDGAPDRVAWPALVRPGWGDDGIWPIEANGRKMRVTAQLRMALSSPVALLDAVLAHLGAALLPETLVAGHMAGGRLVALGTRQGAAEEVWVLHAAGRLPNRRLLALMDVTTAVFAEALPRR